MNVSIFKIEQQQSEDGSIHDVCIVEILPNKDKKRHWVDSENKPFTEASANLWMYENSLIWKITISNEPIIFKANCSDEPEEVEIGVRYAATENVTLIHCHELIVKGYHLLNVRGPDGIHWNEWDVKLKTGIITEIEYRRHPHAT